MTTLLETASSRKPAVSTISGTQRIVLIGFMGAGKTTAGRMLAERLGWQFVDTDNEVELKHGCTVAAMFAAEGEGVFRRRESAALARALGRQGVVIAVGGGAPEVLTNRLLLEQTPDTAVIFLDAPFDVVFDRCVLQEGAAVRPVLMDPAAAAERFHLRSPFYRRCARLHVETGQLGPQATADKVLEVLTASCSV